MFVIISKYFKFCLLFCSYVLILILEPIPSFKTRVSNVSLCKFNPAVGTLPFFKFDFIIRISFCVIQGLTEITPTFGGITTRAMEGIQ